MTTADSRQDRVDLDVPSEMFRAELNHFSTRSHVPLDNTTVEDPTDGCQTSVCTPNHENAQLHRANIAHKESADGGMAAEAVRF
jgi:hypothetical protein